MNSFIQQQLHEGQNHNFNGHPEFAERALEEWEPHVVLVHREQKPMFPPAMGNHHNGYVYSVTEAAAGC
jgi:hypothetical protein